MNWLRLFFISVLAVAALGASLKEGDGAPSLVVATVDGQPFDLSAQAGKVTVVHFLATWCSSCQKEMSTLSAVNRKFQYRGVVMIGVSVDRSRDRDEVVKLAHANSFPIAMMVEAKANGFGVPGTLPKTYVIDGKGHIRKIFATGEDLTEATLADALTVAAKDQPR